MEFDSSKGRITLSKEDSKEIVDELLNSKPITDDEKAFMAKCLQTARIVKRQNTLKDVLWLIEHGYYKTDELTQLEKAIKTQKEKE